MEYVHNWVDFFRFSGHWEDVFIERNDDGTSVTYLYVCAEPWNWAHLLSTRPYDRSVDINDNFNGEWRVYDHTGSSAEYLQTLERAPYEIALEIIRMETRERIAWENEANGYTPDDDEYMEPGEWADYLTENIDYCEEC